MPISESQLAIWTNSPSNTKFSYTYGEIQKALENGLNLTRGIDYVIYLQGSYANSTNIKIDSDVDVVVELIKPWNRNISNLNSDHTLRYLSSVVKSNYGPTQFKKDVLGALQKHFGLIEVKLGTKTIKIIKDQSGRRVNADVLACIQHRHYTSFYNHDNQAHIVGVLFYNSEGKEIINHPKLHIKNGEAKNHKDRTAEKYKHTIRICKNMKRQLVEKGILDSKIAPSYFIESIIYNVPDSFFITTNYRDTLQNAFNFILNQCNPSTMTTGSHQHLLFGNEPWQWNTKDASTFFTLLNNQLNYS